jgi:hypothetical protein
LNPFGENERENGQAKDLVMAILLGDVPKSPQWHGIPCTLPSGTVLAIDTMALRMRGTHEITEAQLDTIRKTIGTASRALTSEFKGGVA